jgi:hypothetical protein
MTNEGITKITLIYIGGLLLRDKGETWFGCCYNNFAYVYSCASNVLFIIFIFISLESMPLDKISM